MKKIPSYIPKVFSVLFIISILPIPIFRTYFKFVFSAPIFSIIGGSEQAFEDQLNKEKEMFPTLPDPFPYFDLGPNQDNPIPNPDYERITQYNQEQVEKRFEYRRTHPMEMESRLKHFLRLFAAQATIIFLFIICSLLSLIRINKKNKFL